MILYLSRHKLIEASNSISHIDRANVGNAKIEGMDKDLGLVGNQYNVISTVFFVPYIIFGKSSANTSPTSC